MVCIMNDLPDCHNREQSPPQTACPQPDKIVVPRQHGQVLTEPALNILAQAAPLWRAQDHHAELAGFSLTHQQMIELARRDLWLAAENHAQAIGIPAGTQPTQDVPWVITGHQVEFYHPGVWAKVVAADEVARRSGGVAFDLLVDHDVIDHLGFDVPQFDGQSWVRRQVHYAHAPAIPADGLTPPSKESFAAWRKEIARYPHAQVNSLNVFLSLLDPAAEGNDKRTYTQWLSRARRYFEQAHDIHVIHVPTSGLCGGQAWRHFVAAWISQAPYWVLHYNHHLARYRKKAGIKNPQHPMPDLERTGNRYELPFWIYRAGQPRERMYVEDGRVIAGDQAYELDALLAAGYVVRPRALTLTMFVRMFVADVFIHGIGGALYDQITDELINDLFAVQPPYGCVSAAWLLPLAQSAIQVPEDKKGIAENPARAVSKLKITRHNATHHPEDFMAPELAAQQSVKDLVKERMALVQNIKKSQQENRRSERAERYVMFMRMHQINETLCHIAPETLTLIEKDLELASQIMRDNKVLLWREYFFAMHSDQSLREFVSQVRRKN